jgi:hypothetical protein
MSGFSVKRGRGNAEYPPPHAFRRFSPFFSASSTELMGKFWLG